MGKIIFPEIYLGCCKGVLLDIDNTLYCYDSVHQKAIRASYNAIICQLNFEISFDDFYLEYRKRRKLVTERFFSQGSCRSRLFAFQSFFEDMNLPSAFNYALKFENLYWRAFISCITLSEDAYRFLESCRENRIKVCAVTDMQAHFQIQKLQALGVDHLIEFLVTSEEVGVEKPDKAIFEVALKKLNLYPDEVIMVGDCFEKDIQGAQSLGIDSYLVEMGHD